MNTRIQPRNKIQVSEHKEIKKFDITKGAKRQAWKIGIYGEPGVGKSTLASLCPNAIFADIEGSMLDMDVSRVEGLNCWEDLREWVQQQESGICGIDSMSKAEDWCADYIIRTKTKDGEHATTSIEDFKYKAGAKFVSDEFRLLLSDIEKAFMRGVSWIMIAHDKIDWYRNPDDKDFRMHNPDLLENKDVSIRADWIRFCDHIAYIGKDVAVQQGKAKGGNSRTIYMDGSANRVSKQRGLDIDVLPWSIDDNTLWKMLKVTKEN